MLPLIPKMEISRDFKNRQLQPILFRSKPGNSLLVNIYYSNIMIKANREKNNTAFIAISHTFTISKLNLNNRIYLI